jgi:hypothetical protein
MGAHRRTRLGSFPLPVVLASPAAHSAPEW